VEALPENSIDAFLDEGLEQTEAFNKSAEQGAILLHRVFVQNEHGAELLEKWKNDLLGKMFVRNIITQIQAVESEL